MKKNDYLCISYYIIKRRIFKITDTDFQNYLK